MSGPDATATVGDLVGLIDRAKKALSEAGRPDLAEHAHVVVLPSGQVRCGTATSSSTATRAAYSAPDAVHHARLLVEERRLRAMGERP